MHINDHTERFRLAGEALNELLKEGRVYYQKQVKTTFGSSGGNIYFVENGVTYDYHNQDDTMRAEIEQIEDRLNSMSDAMSPEKPFSELKPYNKVCFTYQKNKPVTFKVYDVKDLLDDLKNTLIERNSRNAGDNGEFVSLESLIRFEWQADKLGMFIDTTIHKTKRSYSYDFLQDDSILECLHASLDNKLEKLYVHIKDKSLTVQSQPAFPEWGLQIIQTEHVELEETFKTAKSAFEEAQILRHAVYNSLGKMDEQKIYLNVGGFRSINWPENSTSHISEIMRVIYTGDTTLLITDGMSDTYKTKKDHEQYNGTGVEYYMEFDGHVPFKTLKDHFCLALLNSVTQIALNHGDFKQLMENHTYTTIEFNEGNVELWVVRGNNSNKDIKTFFEDKQYKGDKFGVFLGMPSTNVPRSMKLNKEEVLLVNIKPFGQEWLKPAKLKNKSEEIQKKTRLDMMEKWNASGENNRIPVTYNNSGKSNNPEKPGTTMSALIPGL